jgi:hypothetical protein
MIACILLLSRTFINQSSSYYQRTPHLRSSNRSSKASAHNPASIIGPSARSIKVVSTTVGRNVTDIVVVADVTSRVSPSADSISTVSIEASLRAESRVFLESLAVVIGGKGEHEVVVAHEAAGGVLGFEGDTAAVAETRADCPAGLLLECCAA